MLLCLWLWSLAGMAHHGVASPEDAVWVLTLAYPAGLVFAGLRVVCLRSACWFYISVVGAWRCQPLYGRLVCCWACCAAAGVSVVVLVGRGAVVRLFKARERSGCCGGAVGRWLCGGLPAVGVLVEGPATSQLVVAHAAALAGAGCGGGCSVVGCCRCRSPGCRRSWSGPPGKYRVATPCPPAFTACISPHLAAPDLCWHRRSPVLTRLQRMYNVCGDAPPVGAWLAPYGSHGASGVRGVVRSLACPSLPPEPQVCCFLTSLSVPSVPVQVYRAVLAGWCRLLWALGP